MGQDIPLFESFLTSRAKGALNIRLGRSNAGVPVDWNNHRIGVDQCFFSLSIHVDTLDRILFNGCLVQQIEEGLVIIEDATGGLAIRVGVR